MNNNIHPTPSSVAEQRLRSELASSYARQRRKIDVRHFYCVALVLAALCAVLAFTLDDAMHLRPCSPKAQLQGQQTVNQLLSSL